MLQITPKEIIGLISEFAIAYAAAWNTIEAMTKEQPDLPKETIRTLIESKTLPLLGQLEKISLDHYKLLLMYNKMATIFCEDSIEKLYMSDYDEEIGSPPYK